MLALRLLCVLLFGETGKTGKWRNGSGFCSKMELLTQEVLRKQYSLKLFWSYLNCFFVPRDSFEVTLNFMGNYDLSFDVFFALVILSGQTCKSTEKIKWISVKMRQTTQKVLHKLPETLFELTWTVSSIKKSFSVNFDNFV